MTVSSGRRASKTFGDSAVTALDRAQTSPRPETDPSAADRRNDRDLLELRVNRADKKINQLHDYARHLFQVVVAWFTFFATVNYASMGWLAQLKAEAGSPVQQTRLLVSAIFLSQNILGIFACFVIRHQFRALAARVQDYERLVAKELGVDQDMSDQCMPIRLYNIGSLLMASTFTLILAGWAVIPFLSRFSLTW